jgi:hypothetical protein
MIFAVGVNFMQYVQLNAGPSGLSPAGILGSNPTGSMESLCWDCCVLSGRGPYDGLITLSEKSYQLWCVVMCDLETSWTKRPRLTEVCHAKNKQKTNYS